MSDEERRAIWCGIIDVNHARREKAHEAMREYDANVFLPALRALIARCAAIGHKPGRWDSNGLGASWQVCTTCGARCNVESDWMPTGAQPS